MIRVSVPDAVTVEQGSLRPDGSGRWIQLLGVDAPTALGMSLLRQGLAYAYAALGALFFVRWRGHPSVSELRSLSGEAPPGTDSEARVA